MKHQNQVLNIYSEKEFNSTLQCYKAAVLSYESKIYEAIVRRIVED